MKHCLYTFLICMALTLLHSCGEEDYPVPPASTVSKFTVAIDNKEFAPATATFSNTSIIPERAGSATYYWSFGDGTSSTEKDPTHFYQQPGVYSVNLVIVTGSSNEIVEYGTKLIIRDPDASGTPIFFTDKRSLFTALINELAPIVSPVGINLGEAYGVVVDTIHDKVYIPDYGNDRIMVANLDGTDLKEFRTDIGSPTSALIDYGNNLLFWDTSDGIRSTKLDDDNVAAYDDFVTDQGDFDPEGMSIDPVNKVLYWNTYYGGVWRKNLNGTGEVELIPGEGGGSALIIGNRLYYDVYISETKAVELRSVDIGAPTKPNIVAAGMEDAIYGVAYDRYENKLYWNDRTNDRIMRANPDGTSPTPWISDVVATGLAIGKNQK